MAGKILNVFIHSKRELNAVILWWRQRAISTTFEQFSCTVEPPVTAISPQRPPQFFWTVHTSTLQRPLSSHTKVAVEERFMTIGCLCYSKVSFRGQIKPLLNTHIGHLKELKVIFQWQNSSVSPYGRSNRLLTDALITTPTTRLHFPHFLTGAKETVWFRDELI